jgi:hypothetical protein
MPLENYPFPGFVRTVPTVVVCEDGAAYFESVIGSPYRIICNPLSSIVPQCYGRPRAFGLGFYSRCLHVRLLLYMVNVCITDTTAASTQRDYTRSSFRLSVGASV